MHISGFFLKSRVSEICVNESALTKELVYYYIIIVFCNSTKILLKTEILLFQKISQSASFVKVAKNI